MAKPARIALDLLLRLSPRKRGWVRRLRIGVPDLDVFLRSRLVGRAALERQFWGRRNRGIRLARHALQLADPRAESPPESELRVVLVVGGFHPKPQHNVYKEKRRFLGRLDLAIVESKVAIEYDGRWHDTPSQVIHDQERRQQLSADGWTFVIVDSDQLATDYAGILERVRAANERS
jgi:very-short-patch-repair endonuclease